jgi:sarcosine oxidase subunit alpha
VGERVVLTEQDYILGGQAAWEGSRSADSPAATAISAITSQLSRMSNVTILRRTTAVGYYDHDVISLVERTARATPRERFWIVRARRVVLATGVTEQPLLFDHNDRPGIMLAGAARQYVRRYGVAPGRRVIVATNNNSAYDAATDLREAGVNIAAIVDTRKEVPDALRTAMRALGIEVLAASVPVDTTGFGALSGVHIGTLSGDGRAVQSTRAFDCDSLLVSGGWNPTLHLYAQAGGKLAFNEASGALQPAIRHASIEIVGAAAGAGAEAIGPRASPVGNSRRQWVDLLHDVTVADLELALREHYTSVEHVKRYTTVGMAADQGKTSSTATIDILARLRGVHPAEMGYTTQRPPFTPVTLGAIVGRDFGERFSPSRLLPMQDWHLAHGALAQDLGEWRRPVAYLRPGESREQACQREARAVRASAGLFDSSPLGKIEVRGPDALTFVDRFYINNLQTLTPGRVRYGLMLRESGVIFDDGTVAMLAPDHLIITTTSGNASKVDAWLEEWRQCEWSHLRVATTAVTEQWATVSVTGPKARTLVSKLQTDIDLSPRAFPHMTMREGRLLGLPARIYRVSFTGELTYEINVPASAGPRLWEALVEAGDSDGAQPLGLDAMMLLRLEKGFLHVGTDTDGTTVPEDVGWGKVAAGKSAHYIGKRSLLLPENVKPDRLQLVGLTSTVGNALVAGSHLRLPQSNRATDGWITSAGYSIQTGAPVALAMLRTGRQQLGSAVSVHDSGRVTTANVVATPFFDPSSQRMNA